MSELTPLETANICYGMAYFVIPRYLRQRADFLIERLADGNRGAAFLFVMACSPSNYRPSKEELLALSLHEGDLDTGQHYYIVQYPTPPPYELGEKVLNSEGKFERNSCLAPYFSAVIRHPDDQPLDYYTLGQSPVGGTTLRQVDEKWNANLGPGCEPEIGEFIKLISQHVGR